MKTFKNKTDKSAYYFRLAIMILIPVAFFLIEISEGKLYWLGGVMVICVIAAYVLKATGVGDPINNNKLST